MGLFKDCGCGCDGKKQEKKFLISIMAALLFFIIANPSTFRVMRSILGKWVSSPTGCPSTGGLALHTIVYMLITWGLMNIRVEGYEIMTGEMAPSAKPPPMPKKKLADVDFDKVPVEEIDINEFELSEEGGPPPEMMMGPSPMKPPPMMKKAPAPRMADTPTPTPGKFDDIIGFSDSGAMFSSMDINESMDLPAPLKNGSSGKGAVTCSCSNGNKVVITP
tara:strand:- start:1560 stop:2219 length:660 start_codon:yes stop_codon:yes gene_type:complete